MRGKLGSSALLALVAVACGGGVSSLGGHDGTDAAPESETALGSGGSTSVDAAADGASDRDSGPPNSTQPVVFANAIQTSEIVVDDSGVYVLTGSITSDLVRLSKIDGSQTVLATRRPAATHLIADDTDLYFDTDEGVQSVPKAGGALRTVAGAGGVAALDPDSVYWSESDSGNIENPKPVESKLWSVPKSGGSPTLRFMPMVGTGVGLAMAGDTSGLYFQSGPDLQVLPPGAATPNRVAASPFGTYVVLLDETDVYLGGSDASNVGLVTKVPKRGGTPSTIGTLGGRVLRMALDATHVYCTDTDAGTVVKLPKSGGASVVLASEQARPVAIAVDPTTVYWANIGAGTLMKVAK